MVTKKFILLFFSVLFLMPAHSWAKHIIGGEITYECLGDGSIANTRNYRFTMTMYRDCFDDGAGFDNPLQIGIYSQIGSVYSFVRQVSPGLGSVTNINPEDDPCVEIPPNVCVEKGVYIFDVANLPIIGGTYHISWQRCCRNNFISNIVNPASSGATFTVEITALAQVECNDSPTFDNFPPTVICVNQNLFFDHSATDPEGDLIIYEFCAPLNGGGTLGTINNPGNITDCKGARPSPMNCLPPFEKINFLGPNYSINAPMGGDPLVSINTANGLISGRPDVIGQFVVGICVKEYRGGSLLSQIRRDFQFNVTNCENNIVAQVQADSVANFGNEFYIDLCGTLTTEIVNISPVNDAVIAQSWAFDFGDTIVSTDLRDNSITFPDLGTYSGTLIINEGSACTDTAFITVNVYPFIKSDFELEYDTCIAGPVAFTDFSETGSGIMESWNWSFGDGMFETVQNPNHIYQIPGNLPVSLAVEDINGCKDTLTKTISYFPVPPLLIIEPSTFDGCAPARVVFNNLSFPIDDSYTIEWDFGDGTTGDDISPVHVYEDLGVFSVDVRLTSPIGCFTKDSFPDWITVRESPTAGFSYTPERLDNFNPQVITTDESVDAIGWQWKFGNEAISLLPSPSYIFQDTGRQIIEQIVFHQNGCTDTAYAEVDVIPDYRFFLPNAFSPNFDGKNELYKAKGFYDGISGFEMTIWSRWGEKLFESNDPFEGWNGRKFNTGDELPVGVYVAKVKFTGPRNQIIRLQEFATLVR